MKPDNAFANWRVHYETCARCKPGKLCVDGDRLFRIDVPELTDETKRNVDLLDTLGAA